MRPGNFPTIRLAQLAMIFYEKVFLFPGIMENLEVKKLHRLFDSVPNDYWLYHYMLDEPSAFKKKKLGKDAINNIIANTVVPYAFAYGQYHNNDSLRQKAIQIMQEIEAEQNNITRQFRALGVENNCAADSQSLLELKSQYCDQQRCLDCAIGYSLLRKNVIT
jgi:hypothetical protein